MVYLPFRFRIQSERMSYVLPYSCWLSLDSGLVWAFIAPVLCVIMVCISRTQWRCCYFQIKLWNSNIWKFLDCIACFLFTSLSLGNVLFCFREIPACLSIYMYYRVSTVVFFYLSSGKRCLPSCVYPGSCDVESNADTNNDGSDQVL